MRFLALAAAAVLVAGVSGCSGSVKVETSSTPSIGAADLKTDLTDRLAQAGMTAKSVTCKGDLVGEVGKTAACDVEFSENNDIEAVFTATKVEGSTVSFDITPAMTKEQLQKAVSSTISMPDVTCDSGVDGKVGASANCQVTADGVTTKRLVEVTQVDPAKLGLEISVLLVLPKDQVQDLLVEKLTTDGSAQFVECTEDVVAKVGTVFQCSVSADGTDQQPVDVTVASVDGDTVNFEVAPKP